MISPGRFQPPSRQLVVYGEAVEIALPQILRDFWAVQTVSVTNQSLAETGGLAGRIAGILGDTLQNQVTGIRRNTLRQDVMRVTDALRSRGVDSVVTLGGGSVVEAVKAARICLTNNVRSPEDMDRLRRVTTAASPRPYLIAIPTTLSGAEYTQYAGVTDERTGRKDAFHHQDLAPDAVILDPAVTLATPRNLWLSTGIRALDHAVETWCSDGPTPYSDATALYAVRVLMRWLPVSARDPEDREARLACQVASWMAIQGATVGVPHGLSHALGRALASVTGLAHGLTSCLLLPHVLRQAEPAGQERQAMLSQVVGRPGVAFADILAELVLELDLPHRLGEAGVGEDRIDAVIAEARRDPRLAHTEEGRLRALLETAF